MGGDIPEPPGPENVTEEGEDPDLNFEASKNTYSVTVTAKSGTQTTTVTVNIVVTGVNEPPEVKVTDDADGTLLPRTNEQGDELAESENYDENESDPVQTYTAEDPEGLPVSWDLRGADASLFSINGGALRFVNSPNYENPASLDGDNTATEDADGRRQRVQRNREGHCCQGLRRHGEGPGGAVPRGRHRDRRGRGRDNKPVAAAARGCS